MTLAILSLLGTLAGLVFWLIRRRASRVDDPVYQHEQRKNQINQAVASGDANGIDLILQSHLDRLRDQQSRGDTSGPGGKPAGSG